MKNGSRKICGKWDISHGNVIGAGQDTPRVNCIVRVAVLKDMTDLYGIIREWIRGWAIRRDVRRMVEKHGVQGVEDKLMELGCTKIVTRTSRIYTTPTQGKIEFTEDEIIINPK